MNHSKKLFIFNFLFICFTIAAITGCNENKKGSNNLNSTESNTSSDNTACFEEYKTDLMAMLTKDEILSVYHGDMAGAELKSDVRDKYSSFSSYTYSWPGDPDRVERIMASGRDFGPMNYRIGAGYLDFYKEGTKFIIKNFTSTYNLTDAKKAAAKEAINKELEKQGVDTKTKKTSKAITNSIIPDLKFTPVEGIGDAAVWSYIDSSLIVLKGRTKFRVMVDISDNHEEDVALAKKLAQIILDKCE